jgi:hypothetical protein
MIDRPRSRLSMLAPRRAFSLLITHFSSAMDSAPFTFSARHDVYGEKYGVIWRKT